MTNVKIIIGGDRGTGKTRLFRTLFGMPLSDLSAYYPTFEPVINTISMNELNLEIWDLPGILPHDMESSNTNFNNIGGVILLFDLTRILTYESVSKWVEKVWSVSQGAPIIIVANKLDLAPTHPESKKMLTFAQQFVEKINKNTSFYCKLMEITAAKEKNAFRVFNELLVAIQYIKGGKKGEPGDITIINELEKRIKEKKNEELGNYKTPIFAQEDKILSEFEKLLANTRANPKPATIQKVTHFLKNNREIRTTFMHLKQFYVDELINDAQSNASWLVEENFLFLVIFKYFQQFLNQMLPPEELSLWCKQFSDMFIIDKESFIRFMSLTPKTAAELLMMFRNNPDIIQSGQYEMEIYSAYRDEVYEN